MKHFIVEALKGVLIGLANIIPGVSGGTMMVSMGIYDTLIHSITHLFKEFKQSVKKLLPYVVGILAGILIFASVIEYLFTHFPLPTSTAFIGLILGGVPVILRKAKIRTSGPLGALLLLLFFAAIILLQVFGSGVNNVANIQLSFVEVLKLCAIGAIASATMVIPGVSGSMMLMIMGYYNPIIGAVNSLRAGITSLDGAVLTQSIGILLPFGVGIVLGIFIIAKVIETLLKKWEGPTYCAILGLVIASPVVILLQNNMTGIDVIQVLVSLVTFAAGFYLAYILDKKAPKEGQA